MADDIVRALKVEAQRPYDEEHVDAESIWRQARLRRLGQVLVLGAPALAMMAVIAWSAVQTRTAAPLTDGGPRSAEDEAALVAPSEFSTPPVGASASSDAPGSRAVLLDLAGRVRSAPPNAEGRYHYLRMRQEGVRVVPGTPGPASMSNSETEIWYADDGSGRIRRFDGVVDEVYGPGELPVRVPPPSALPTDAQQVLAVLTEQHVSDEPLDVHLYYSAVELLQLGAPPQTRATVYEMLAGMSSVTAQPGAPDPHGRPAVRFFIETGYSGAQERLEAFVDPETGLLLGTRSTLLEPMEVISAEVPFVTSRSTVIEDARVSDVEDAPGG